MFSYLLSQMVRVWLLLFLFTMISTLGAVQAAQPEKILIRNVWLIDRYGKTEDKTVNILIKGEKLNIVTTDEIQMKDGLIGYDAQNGVVMGVLNIGQPANFLILDQDPRKDIEVLLDTKTHVVFAVRNGAIVRNSLPGISALEPELEKETPRWLAYTPPPMALPITYQDKTKWNRFDTRYISGIFVAAVALDRQRWLSQNDRSEKQVGDLGEFEGGEIRAFRLGFAGTLNFRVPWFYQFMVATNAFDKGYNSKEDDDFTLIDYRLDIPLSQQIVMSVGKQKEPISMERLLMGTQIQMPERPAVADSMFSFRNVGITFSGTGFERRMTWAAGCYNDWFDDSQNFSESENVAVGRVTGLVWVNEDDSHLLHLGLGIRYTDAEEGIRYRARPEFNQSEVFVDTGEMEADKSITSDLEVSWRRGPYWVASEFVRNEVDSPQLRDPVFSGYHVTGSWVVTREMRAYNRRNGIFGPVPVSKSVYHGGPGAWEVAARYSSLDLSDGKVDGGEMDIYSLGLNWYLSPIFSLALNYRHIQLDRYGVRGSSDGLMGRVILMLE